MDYRLGRLPSPDPRDRRYPMRLLLDPLREQFFPRGIPEGTRHYRQGPVLDQGATGTCVGHGWRGWMSGAPLMTKTGPDAFAIYRGCVGVDEWSDNDGEATAPVEDLQFGTSVRAGAVFLQRQGHVQNYLWAESLEDVRAWHLSGMGGVVLGINWYYSMFATDPHGFLRVTGTSAGGHCIKTTGWSDTKRDPVTGTLGAVRILNSWGRSWGQSGRAWIGRDDLQKLLFEDQWAECCAAVEQKVTPV